MRFHHAPKPKETKMATPSKKGQVKLADMKPTKDAKGGKKLSVRSSQKLTGGGARFGPRSTSKGPAVHEN